MQNLDMGKDDRQNQRSHETHVVCLQGVKKSHKMIR